MMVNFAFRFLAMPPGHPRMDALHGDVSCHYNAMIKRKRRAEKAT